ncbi:MAG TPA: HAD hydrolase family protein [Bdellovibrionota bacterium]|jgi:3-deoxy-D-manno-octulosonate 8-phosphate phosphatase (KDO 8-P phosphatase)
MAKTSAKKRKRLSGKALLAALKKVKVVIFDIDGVMTDGSVFYVEGTGWGAFYNVWDGFGIRQLQKDGLEVCFISGGDFESHRKRAERLNIRHAYFGNEDKLGAYEAIRKDLGVREEDCAYMGDELFDIPVLKTAGFAAAPPHSPAAVKNAVHYVTKNKGGHGAVRELCDLLLEARKK